MNKSLAYILIALLLLAACGTAPETAQSTATNTPEPATATPTDTPTDEPPTAEPPTVEPTATEVLDTEEDAVVQEVVEPTAVPVTSTPAPPGEGGNIVGVPRSDEDVSKAMFQMTGESRDDAALAIRLSGLSQDQRLIPPLIEMLRFGQLGLSRPGLTQEIPDALARLSGEDFGFEWGDWVEWYGNTDIEPHPDFLYWKGQSLKRIDPGFEQFFELDSPMRLRPEEVQWGGVRLDGIPALDQSPQIPAAQATYIDPLDPVFGMAINGDARAYPLRIMDWHEMANDVIGGVPVSIAYCTLCGAAVAYDGRGSDGTSYDFGSSGFLYRSNKLMYDRQTYTLWNQLTGEPVLGELAGTDVRLNLQPIVLTTWEQWQAQHPETTVLAEDTGFRRDYSPGAAYGGYFSADSTMFPVPQRSDTLGTKQQIYALTIDGLPRAYPIETVAEEQVINDTLSETNVAVIGTRGVVDVSRVWTDDPWYSAGSEIRVFDRGERQFAPTDDPMVVVDETGAEWQVTEDGLIGPDGEVAERIAGHLAYWFGWYAFFPNTTVYGQ